MCTTNCICRDPEGCALSSACVFGIFSRSGAEFPKYPLHLLPPPGRCFAVTRPTSTQITHRTAYNRSPLPKLTVLLPYRSRLGRGHGLFFLLLLELFCFVVVLGEVGFVFSCFLNVIFCSRLNKADTVN